MKTLTKISVMFISVFVLCALVSVICEADIPHLINYQGKLTDKDNKPVIDGTYPVTFRIYDSETAGSLLWEETQSITVQKGVFSALLGGVTNLDLSFDKPYFLEIKVKDEVLSPRQRIASVGYAYRAEHGVPRGVIAMWTGAIVDIPFGWVICDGANGTPDLRDKFVVGARQDDSGIAKTNITGSLTQSGGSVDISHTHSTPNHQHGANYGGDYNKGRSSQFLQVNGLFGDVGTIGTEAGGGYFVLKGGTNTSGSGTTGSGGSVACTQPYYALAYIMKL